MRSTRPRLAISALSHPDPSLVLSWERVRDATQLPSELPHPTHSFLFAVQTCACRLTRSAEEAATKWPPDSSGRH